jgi:hypothetical protein
VTGGQETGIAERPLVPVPVTGTVIIEWPPPKDRENGIGVIPGWQLRIWDVPTGKPVPGVMRAVIDAPGNGLVMADLTMLAGEDGSPVFDGIPQTRDGAVICGTFRFLVAEMRARDAETA